MMGSLRSGILAITLMIPVAFALPGPELSHTYDSPIIARDEKHPTWGCPFFGNSDLYGLGIRLGVYLQLFSTLLANSFLPIQIREEMQNTNAIIMIAIFAGMINATTRGTMNSVEIFVMSTLLTAFLWSCFTPGHISEIVLFERGADNRLLDGENSAIGTEEIGGRKTYSAAIARSIFGTAIAVFNVWYWLYSRHTLLKNGIDNPICQPTIFLHMQIILDGYQPMFYIVLSVAYAAYELVFMVWWVAVLTPGTVRLSYDISRISVTAIVKLDRSRLAEIRSKIARWYLGFARLHPKALVMFDRVRMSIKTQQKIRKACYFIKWFGLPAGYTVIIWSALAIELTLAWNVVSGVYVLGSTGQLIPFVVGILGLLRNLHLIALRISEKVSGTGRRDMKIDWTAGRFVYRGKGGKELEFEVNRPERRWSLDSRSQTGSVPLSESKRPSQSARSLTWRS